MPVRVGPEVQGLPRPLIAGLPCAAVKFPPIAPLTRREAAAARHSMPYFEESLQILAPDMESRQLVEAMVRELSVALDEYDGRPLLTRWLSRDPGHKTRLRDWMLEVKGLAESRLAAPDA